MTALTEQIAVRLDPDMRARIEALAAREERTMAQQVRWLLRRALEDVES